MHNENLTDNEKAFLIIKISNNNCGPTVDIRLVWDSSAVENKMVL